MKGIDRKVSANIGKANNNTFQDIRKEKKTPHPSSKELREDGRIQSHDSANGVQVPIATDGHCAQTKLSSSVQTLLAHSLTVDAGTPSTAGNSTSIPSHQHFLAGFLQNNKSFCAVAICA